MPPIKPASAKAKGRRFQQWIRTQLIKSFGLSPTDVQSQPMGSGGEDLVLGDQSRKVFPYSIEAKHRQSYKELYKAYEQARANTPKGCEPLFIVRTNREDPLVVMSFDHFIHLAQVSHENCGPFLDHLEQT